MTIRLRRLLIVPLLLLHVQAGAVCLGDSRAPRSYSVHVVPQLAPSVVFAKWAPFLERLGRQSGQCFELFVAATIPDFEHALFSGQADFAFTNPYHEVIARRRQGYLPLVIDGKNRLSGILTVKSDSPVKSLKELDGKVVAFPAPNAFAASLLIRAQLARQGVNIQPKYLKTHASVYRAVVLGEVAAGGGVNNTLQRETASVRERLRILHETPGYAPHPFVAHPRIPAAARKAVTDAFVRMAADSSARQDLDEIQIPLPMRSDYRRDFAPLEQLGIDKFLVLDAD